MEIYIRKFEGVGGCVWGWISQNFAPFGRYPLDFVRFCLVFTQNLPFSVYVYCNRRYFAYFFKRVVRIFTNKGVG